jgi:Flp pilus assembly protein TadG
MRPISASRKRERGLAIVITAFMMLFLVPMVGLGIDVGMLFMLRNKMSAAADAAALGAARGVNVNGDPNGQKAAAMDMAVSFFLANFPDGYLGTRMINGPDGRKVSTSFSSPGQVVTITSAATVEAPTFFMRTLGMDTVPVKATGTATRRSTNFVLLLDKSGSLVSACGDMKEGAKDFLRLMSREFDRVSIIAYASQADRLIEPTRNWDPAAFNAIDGISCSGSTASIAATNMGYGQLVRLNESLARNVMVFFTDGLPNALAAYYPVMEKRNIRMSHNMRNTSGGDVGPGPGCTPGLSNCDMHPMLSATFPIPVARCTDGTLRHLTSITQASGGAWTGATVAQNAGPVLNYSTGAYTNVNMNFVPSCAPGGGGSWTNDVRRAVAFIPPIDYFGNAIYGAQDPANTGHPLTADYNKWDPVAKGYGAIRENWFMPDNGTWVQDKNAYNHYFPDGHPYQRRMRPDSPSVMYGAGISALDSQGLRVRQDPNLKIKVFTVGYKGVGNIDDIALARLANDGSTLDTNTLDNDVFGSATRTEAGVYVKATDPAQLRAAFVSIASSVLRLSQ